MQLVSAPENVAAKSPSIRYLYDWSKADPIERSWRGLIVRLGRLTRGLLIILRILLAFLPPITFPFGFYPTWNGSFGPICFRRIIGLNKTCEPFDPCGLQRQTWWCTWMFAAWPRGTTYAPSIAWSTYPSNLQGWYDVVWSFWFLQFGRMSGLSGLPNIMWNDRAWLSMASHSSHVSKSINVNVSL